MIVCTKCFKDPDIIERIASLKNRDTCTFHPDSTNSYTLDTSIDGNIVHADFQTIVELYSLSDDDNSTKLYSHLSSDWDIFALDAEQINTFIKDLLSDEYKANPTLFNNSVSIVELNDPNFIKEKSILGTHSWDQFCNDIKYKSRFFTDYLRKEHLLSFLQSLKTLIPKGEIFYRARIINDEDSALITEKEMLIPPRENVTDGRLNSKGIGSLYLANDKKLAVAEIRASFEDTVYIATCKASKNLHLIDLSKLDVISPFALGDSDMFLSYQVNRKILKSIANQMITPTKLTKNRLEYLPTQYISEIIKTEYDGIKYASTMTDSLDEHNIVLFDQSNIILHAADIHKVKINKVSHEWKTLNDY